jgi:hypothetical protein
MEGNVARSSTRLGLGEGRVVRVELAGLRVEAEILRAMKIADLPRAAEPMLDRETPEEPAPKRRRGRQPAFKF